MKIECYFDETQSILNKFVWNGMWSTFIVTAMFVITFRGQKMTVCKCSERFASVRLWNVTLSHDLSGEILKKENVLKLIFLALEIV